MTVIAKRPDAAALALSPLLSDAIRALTEAPRRYSNPGDDAPLVIASSTFTPAPAVIAEAQQALPGIELALAPASLAEVRRWLQRVNAGVRIPLDQSEFDLRASAISAVCGDLPGRTWSEEALRAGLRRWRYFPSAADVAELLEEAAKPLFAARDAVLRLANGNRKPNARPEPRRAPTQDELAYVRSRVDDFKASAAAAAPTGARAPR